MTNNPFRLWALCLLVVLAGCSGSEEEPAPPSVDGPFEPVPEAQLSYLETPIALLVSDLEALINRKVKGEIFRDQELGKRGSLRIDMAKAGDIRIRPQKGRMHWQVPLAVNVHGASDAGKKLPFELTLHLSSAVDLDSKWKLITTTKLQNITWQKPPVVKLGFLEIDLTGFVTGQIGRRESTLMKQLDQAVYKNVNLKKSIGKVWADLQKPILINKKLDTVWLQIQPESILQGPVAFHDDHLMIDAMATAWLNTATGDRPEPGTIPLPDLSKEPHPGEGFELFLSSFLPYDRLSEVLTEQLNGQSLNVQQQALEVQKMTVSGGGKDLIIRMDVAGNFEGTLYLTGTPVFDPESVALKIDDFDFDIHTRDLFPAIVDWLGHDDFKAAIAPSLTLPLGDLIQTLPDRIQKALAKGKVGERVDVIIERMDVDPQALVVGEKGLHTLIQATGKTTVRLRKL